MLGAPIGVRAVTATTIELKGGFWNLRGSFRLAGLVELGTQASLVRRENGRFLMLDSVALGGDQAALVDHLTDDGALLDAILHLHPFHTLHAEAVHRRYPSATLHGTQRHRKKLPELPWADEPLEADGVLDRFNDVLEFSIPAGVDFISADENVHFSSILAFHPSSRTLHVDDTFIYVAPDGLARWTPFADEVRLHPTLGKALQPEPRAADAFRAWADGRIDAWGEAVNLCAAHTGPLLDADNEGAPLARRLRDAIDRAEDTLTSHAKRYDGKDAGGH